VLAGVIDVDDEDGEGEVFGGDGLVVGGAVDEDHDQTGLAHAAPNGFAEDAIAEIGAGFDGGDIGGGGGVAAGPTVVIDGGLREDAAEFGFVCFGRPLVLLFVLVYSDRRMGVPVPS
jgi:hypothetical protein